MPFSKFESSLGRTLAPLEFEKIKEWVSQGVSEELILLCLDECKAKSSKVTLRAIDRLIIKKLSEKGNPVAQILDEGDGQTV